MKDEINNNIIDSFSKIFREIKHSIFYKSKNSEVTLLQYQALWCIKKSKKAHMGDIAKNFSITMPTATSLIDKLIQSKLAKRENDNKDRRIVRISLTNEGEKILKEMTKQRKNKINKLLSYLSVSDKKELSKILNKLVEKTEVHESSI